MELVTGLELANDNAAGNWLVQARVSGWETRTAPGWTAVRCERDRADAHRVVVTRPYPEPRVLEEELAALCRGWHTRELCLEDPYGGLDLARFGCEAALPQPVMVREPDPVTAAEPGTADGAPGGAARGPGPAAASDGPQTRSGTVVEEALDGACLAVAERLVVEGFPVPARTPWRRGALFPEALLTEPGWRAWVARLDGAPAGACMSWDDGSAVGLYWVATLPQYRSQGVARAVLEAVLAAHRGRPATLTATLLGEPLYRRLGFTERGRSRWWRHTAAAAKPAGW